MSTKELTLFRLINPSDPYTFYAPSLEVAGVCVALLSTGFGAEEVGGSDESTPVVFGWDQWLEARGIDSEWIFEHRLEIADAYDSFLIGDEGKREDVESMLSMLNEEQREKWRNDRQDRHRTSMNQIGEAAYARAKAIREGTSLIKK